MNSKFSLFFICVLILPCLLWGHGTGVPVPVALKYHFTKYSPYDYVITKKGNIYVEDDHVVFKFDRSGNLLSKIPVPGDKTYSVRSIAVTDDESVIFFYLTGRHAVLLGYGVALKKTVYKSFFDGGGDIRHDRNGNIYLPYQDASDASKHAVNKIRVFSASGKNYDYPTSVDVEGNFEVVDSNIVTFTTKKMLYLLPAGAKAGKLAAQKNLSVISDGGKFIGCIHGAYIFSDYSDKLKKDIIRIYDAAFNYLKSCTLDFTLKDVVTGEEESGDSGDLFSDLPAGNVYFYDNNDHIYFLRYTRKGTFIYNLSDFVN